MNAYALYPLRALRVSLRVSLLVSLWVSTSRLSGTPR